MVSDIRFYRVSRALGGIVVLGALLLGCAPFSESRDDAPPVDPGRSDAATSPAPGSSDGGSAAADAAADAATSSASSACNGAADCERVVFVTSEAVYGGLIYGVTGADTMCNRLAAASSHPRVAGREFVAWLSDSTRSPSTSLVHGTRAYVRPDGVRIATDYARLTNGAALEMPIEIDESGATQDGAVWSATTPSGVRDGATCDGWSNPYGAGARGDITATAGRWTMATDSETNEVDTVDCNTTDSRIYCFEK
jgi:hypothetical protein